MKKKQFMIILSAVGLIFLLCWVAAIILVAINLRGLTTKNVEPVVINITLCDVKASDLCVVNFGANNLNRMVINFQLPNADYPTFYIKAVNRETVSVYTCEVAEAVPTSAYCTGVRTPLGETINIEAYTTDKNQLIARGSFLVSAIALSTPINVSASTPNGEETPALFSTPEGESTQRVIPTKTQIVISTPKTSTPTPAKTPTAGHSYP